MIASSTSPATPSSLAVDWDRFVAVADRIAPDFDARVSGALTELVNSSILFSDGLCVCALCELLEVDCLVESGTGYGGSTQMFARYFAGSDRVGTIWSIDTATSRWEERLIAWGLRRRSPHVWSWKRGAHAIARERLRPFAAVTLVEGDAMTELPRAVSRFVATQARVGVVIDGPKGEPQLQLAEQVLGMSPLVRFAAIDDIGPKFADRRHDRFQQSPYAAFATSEPRYFTRYRWLDRERMPDYMRRVPDHSGYGLGVLINR